MLQRCFVSPPKTFSKLLLLIPPCGSAGELPKAAIIFVEALQICRSTQTISPPKIVTSVTSSHVSTAPLALPAVTCNIMQKTGAGLHCTCTSYWDPDTDGKQTVVWENPTMHVIVTVFWLGI
ncbi:hypothetical protein KFL_003540090 [Klebsormidium nitens]|uniref:Dynein light chain n=1 Tax=Klebsormidium nitens TaxID=105231 RepID=A0A1Y1IFB4_KLENI|nr:hypothetical protein KFL_003540090 [Klebsormidium nitens]|eukprot:GAQ87456.1 hypothetical protein KFL_003540090 [Klebsormidium nitens]